MSTDELAAEERRILAGAGDYERDDGDAAKNYVDALFEVAALYREHARSYDTGRMLRMAIRVIKETGAREEMLPEAHLELAEIYVAAGEPAMARKALAAARRAIDQHRDIRARPGLLERAAELAKAIDKLPDAPAAQTPRERWAHPTFGEGVLERREDSVVHLRFPDGTVRKFSVQYVTRIED